MEWTRELALAVIKEAQRGGFERFDPPENKEGLFLRAQEWVEEAKKEYKSGGKPPTVLAILSLVEGQLEHGNTAVADKSVEEPDHALTAVENTYPRRSSGGLSESDEREVNAFLEHNLPIPREIDHEPSVMPSDITELGDKQVRKLSSEYNAYLARAKWLLALATTSLANSTHLRDAAYRKAFKDSHMVISIKGDRPTKDLVDSMANEDTNVKNWNEAVQKHSD